MDQSPPRGRFLRRVFLTPWVLAPAGLGLVMTTWGLWSGSLLWPAVGGIVLLATGVVAAGRFAFGFERYRSESAGDASDSPSAARMSMAVPRSLRQADDPESRELLRQLEQLGQRLARIVPSGSAAAAPPQREVLDKAGGLLRSCLAALERAAAMGRTAAELTTEGSRAEVRAQREKLLREIGESTARLGATLDQLQLAALQTDAAAPSLTQARAELDRGLEVARRVEVRMAEWEREISGPLRE